jgi:hypothetical protein
MMRNYRWSSLMTHKIPLQEISKLIPEGIAVYIGMASFETRCHSILEVLNPSPSNSLIFKNENSSALTSTNLAKMIELTAGKNTVINLNLDSSIALVDAFVSALSSAKLGDLSGTVFVDTTTFTHELLLILLRVLDQLRPKCRILMGYTGAENYSTNTTVEQVWLSRGVSQIRSVVGYPGIFAPSKNLHLILMVGFEYERAAIMIERMEPAKLSLGVGERGESVSAEHCDTNERFYQELTKFLERTQLTFSEVETFKFSCVDPFKAKNTVLEQVRKNLNLNAVVSPMNTKISTIGVGLAALEEPRIQIAYARATEYNELGYSVPSTQATIFELKF